MGRLENKVALITGGASAAGLGFATARLFLNEGASVVLTDLSPEVKERVSDLPDGARITTLQQDVSHEEEWLTAFAAAVEAFGTVDILVNNAGITRRNPIEKMALETWQSVVETNLTGTFLGCKHAVDHMRASGNGGSIVNIASISGVVGMRNSSPYGASKGGIRSLTKVVALETARDRIRCNTVCPGMIMSDIHTAVIAQMPEAHKKLVDAIPAGYLGKPEDIAHAALYLASPESSYVTGAEIVVDGGYTSE